MRLRKRFLDGVASLVDLFGTRAPQWPQYRDGFAADREAIAGDWQRVGDGLRRAMERVAREAEDDSHAQTRKPGGTDDQSA